MNENVYIHELIDVIGHGRARYMHHMTANWCPVAREERNQRCFGVWGTVGSTGRWPQVVNLWEIAGWDGLAADLRHETSHPGHQDPALAEWWATAASLRSGGLDRICVPEPWSPTIDELCEAGVRGELYAHELVTLPSGGAPGFLAEVRDQAVSAHAELGIEPVAALRVAMGSDTEAILIWAIPTWEAWTELEQAWLAVGGPLSGWRRVGRELGATWQRFVMCDAPLAPLRTGRQPQVEDRRPLDEV